MLMLTTVTEEELLDITEVAALTLAALSGALEESVTLMLMPTMEVMVVMAVVSLDITEAVLLMLDLPSGVLEERSVTLMPMLTSVMVLVLLHITEVVLLMLDLPFGVLEERSVMLMLNQKLMLTMEVMEEV